MKSHYRKTISISVVYLFLCLFITYVSSYSLIRQITEDSNTSMHQQEEVHYVQTHQEIASRDYKVSASNTVTGLRDRRPSTYFLKIESFNTILKSTVVDKFETRPFPAGGYNWYLQMGLRGKAVGLHLVLTGKQRTGDYELVYVLAKLRVLNQRKLNNRERQLEFWYGRYFVGGFSDLISFDDLRDSSKGFLVNDVLMVEVQLQAISTTKRRSAIRTKTSRDPSSRDYKVSASNPVTGLRDRRPSTYSLKIVSFNTILKSTVVDKFETRPFSAGGYNWTLHVYPNGNKKDGGSGYISLYVAIEKSSLVESVHQEVYADLRFYIFNKNERKYFTIQDIDVWRFNALKTMWGFSKVLPLDTFKDPTNGYLYDGDHCEFGVDVIVDTPFEKSELFSVRWSSEKFAWTIQNFSTLVKDNYYPDVFSLGGKKWFLQMDQGCGKAVGLYLVLTGKQRTGDYELVYVLAKLRVLNQRKLSNREKQLEFWYGRYFVGGFSDLISFDDLRDSSKGFLVNDALMVEVELQAISTTKYFPS
ncbi:unnamed protein product [Thlaspi arvense]|uniref:MATH domain-containing protein n=1 Tax=Thlaspi arvense TaxID=13288 RepID=A0AAU9SEC0_THLAR|nr:unnamed protein product [Thlaspi arvense]